MPSLYTISKLDTNQIIVLIWIMMQPNIFKALLSFFRQSQVSQVYLMEMTWQTNKRANILVMNQHLLVIFVYVHQRYNTYWYVETDFYVYDRPRNDFMTFFCLFFFYPPQIVSPLHIRSAFTTKLRQLYKEGRPWKVGWGEQVSQAGGARRPIIPPDGRWRFSRKRTSWTVCVLALGRHSVRWFSIITMVVVSMYRSEFQRDFVCI